MSISSHAPKALYQQVKAHILEKIESGQWPPDTKIPSENQLVKTLKVSRMTVNRALRELSGKQPTGPYPGRWNLCGPSQTRCHPF